MRSLQLLAIGFAISMSSSVFGSQECTDNCVSKLVTDFSGKPPFKRRLEVLPVVEVAEVEVSTSEPVWVNVRTVDFKGKPPFKRKIERLEQTDIMQVELTSDEEPARKGPKKPTGNSIFKRH